MPQKDPCQKQACAIQKCLQANNYIESRCEDVIQAMRRCCEDNSAETSVCCSGFRKEMKSTKDKTHQTGLK
ncbi:cx9C motif-containing protein 4 [Trichomycterus rosablanca]|uniref:cx9C motif-containing protein 4 n=1 Tax=Trichomycterus rosablanca TaxID=2290929 RepID=UPI002F350760